MPRVFAYCRVSTLDQTTQNQRLEIKAAGFAIEAHRLIEETISGSVAAKQRPGFTKLIDRMESGDVLVVSLIDLGAMRWMSGLPSSNWQALAYVCIALPLGVLISPARQER